MRVACCYESSLRVRIGTTTPKLTLLYAHDRFALCMMGVRKDTNVDLCPQTSSIMLPVSRTAADKSIDETLQMMPHFDIDQRKRKRRARCYEQQYYTISETDHALMRFESSCYLRPVPSEKIFSDRS